jgi:hypothetical protein
VAQVTSVYRAIPSSIHFLNRAMRSAGQAPLQGTLPSTRVAYIDCAFVLRGSRNKVEAVILDR